MGIAYQKILTFCNATHSQSTIIVLELLCAIFCATNCKYIRCWPTTLYVAIFIFAIISLTSISISFDSIFIRWCGCTIVHRTLGYTIYVYRNNTYWQWKIQWSIELASVEASNHNHVHKFNFKSLGKSFNFYLNWRNNR